MHTGLIPNAYATVADAAGPTLPEWVGARYRRLVAERSRLLATIEEAAGKGDYVATLYHAGLLAEVNQTIQDLVHVSLDPAA